MVLYRSTQNNLRVYISNIVNKIQQIDITILHVPGKENPADLCCKPKSTSAYINNHKWSKGEKLLEDSIEHIEKQYKIPNKWCKIYSIHSNTQIMYSKSD